MSNLTDQDLDALLRRDFVSSLPNDEGFSERVMHLLPHCSLPQRPAQRSWLIPTAAATGVLLAWLTLLPSSIWQQIALEWLSADFGANSVVLLALVLGMGLLACAWALEETA